MRMTKDKSTDKGNSNRPSANHAQILVKALKGFILPIVNIRNQEGQDVHDSNHNYLAPEAQALVEALEKFVAAVVHPNLNLHDTTENGEAPGDQASGSKPKANFKLDEDSSTLISKTEPPAEKPALLKLALEGARQRVFNKMPIRLLSFKKDGFGIELIERGVLWQRISAAIEADFDKQKMESKILDGADKFMRTFKALPQDHAMAEAQAGAIRAFISQYTQYAILSHTWLHDSPGEVTYANWMSGQLDESSPGYQKLANFCKIAATNDKFNVTLGWMDTICINKESSSELDESIRSMYKWYSDAIICIAYLAQTLIVSDMRHDAWFTRGWTLQELLAPSTIKFYSASWKELVPAFNDRNVELVHQEITAATTIKWRELLWFRPSLEKDISEYITISRRMQWAANRHVTREEDGAYSLMGIFGVSISIAYGEGAERAFIRLVKEILSSSNGDVLDVINWGSGSDLVPGTKDHPSSLIPSSPKQYLYRTKEQFVWPRLVAPITLTHLGFHLPVLLMPAIDASYAPLNPIGNYYASIQIGIEAFLPSRIVHQRFNVLTKPNSIQNDKDRANARLYVVLGVLNFTEYETAIELPSSFACFAVALRFQGDVNSTSKFRRMLTDDAVVFKLKNVTTTSDYKIPKMDLTKHGMELLTMYL